MALLGRGTCRDVSEVAEEDFGRALADDRSVVGVGETFRGSAFIGCAGGTGGGGDFV